MNAKEYDAKKAELEAKLALAITATHQLSVAANDSAAGEKRIKDDLAALGPRPSERNVTWTNSIGNLVTWTFTDGKFWTDFGGSANDGLYISADVPHDVALRVLLLAWPEDPTCYVNLYSGDVYPNGYLSESAARKSANSVALEVAVPLYRAPVGIAAGACVVKDGKVYGGLYHSAEWAQRAQKVANDNGGTVYDLIAVPRKEAT